MVIPNDPGKWDTLAQPMKKLSEEDRKEATAYMMRMSVAAAFSGNKSMVFPIGTTLGDGIKEQKAWDADQKLQQVKADALKNSVLAQRAKAAEQISKAETFSMVSMTLRPENFMEQRIWPQLHEVFVLSNNTNKDITALKGQIEFKDSFGALITTENLSVDDTITAHGQKVLPNYYLDIKTDEQKRLSTMELTKVKADFVPEAIAFSDGTNITAPDDPST